MMTVPGLPPIGESMPASTYSSSGRCVAVVAVELEQLARPLNREHDVAADDLPLHRVQAELEARDDAEVAAAAADRPVEVRVLVGARMPELAVGRHDVDAP